VDVPAILDLNTPLPSFVEVDNKHQATFAFNSNYPSRAVLKHIGGFVNLEDIEKAEIYVGISNSYQEIGFTAGYTTGSTSEEIVIDLFTADGEAPLKTTEVRFTLKNNGSLFYSAKIYSGTKETTVRYMYDASGRRVLRTYSGGNYSERPGNTRAVYNGVTLIEERTQATSALVRRFTYGTAINELIQVEEDQYPKNPNGSLTDTNDKIFIPVIDDRGTLVGVIDGKSKQLIEKLYYNSTGLVKSYSAIPVANAPSAEIENLDENGANIARSKFIAFGWTGMYHEPVTNLYHTLYREYDPMHERWLSEDPAGYADGLNLYGAYMGVNGVDALGLWDEEGVKKAYNKKYANDPKKIKALEKFFDVGFRLEQGDFYAHDYYPDFKRKRLAIASSEWLGWEMSNENAASQLLQALSDDFFKLTDLPETWGGMGSRVSLGAGQAVGGLISTVGGTALLLTPEPTCATKVGGVLAIGYGVDSMVDGATSIFNRSGGWSPITEAAGCYGELVAGKKGRESAEFWANLSKVPGGFIGGKATIDGTAKSNIYARYKLSQLEKTTGNGSHFYSRHGAQTCKAQQLFRSLTGFTPDGQWKELQNATRFLNFDDQLMVFRKAEEFLKLNPNATKFIYTSPQDIGEGYQKATGIYFITKNVQVYFQNGHIQTMFPKK